MTSTFARRAAACAGNGAAIATAATVIRSARVTGSLEIRVMGKFHSSRKWPGLRPTEADAGSPRAIPEKPASCSAGGSRGLLAGLLLIDLVPDAVHGEAVARLAGIEGAHALAGGVGELVARHASVAVARQTLKEVLELRVAVRLGVRGRDPGHEKCCDGGESELVHGRLQ